MDAAALVITPPPAPTSAAVDAGSQPSATDAAAFAAHLEGEPVKPAPPRKAPPSAEEPVDGEAPPSFSLSSPAAPVLVRMDGAPVPVTMTLAAPSGATPAPSAAPAIAPPGGAPAPSLPAAPAAANVAGAAPQDGAAAPPPSTQPAPAMQAGDAGDAARAALAAVAPTLQPPAGRAPTVDPQTEPLRAGRHRAARAEGADAPTPSSANGAAGAPSNGGAQPRVEAANAAAGAPGQQSAARPADSAAPAPAPAVDALQPQQGEARRLAEAPPSVVHRPPTTAATVAQQIIRRFEGQSTSIEVRLEPVELGRVQVKLDVGADARVTAVVAADNPATLSDLMRSSRELERALESAGLELVAGGLSFDLSDRGNAFTPEDAPESLRGPLAPDTAPANDAAPASRPFGLEAWRGVRVDMTV